MSIPIEQPKPTSALTRACNEMNANLKNSAYFPAFIPNESNRTISVRLPNVKGVMKIEPYTDRKTIKAKLGLQLKKQKMLDLEVEQRERGILFKPLF